GKSDRDADRPYEDEEVCGARARSGAIDHIADEADAIRGWIRMAIANATPFADQVLLTQRLLATAPPTGSPARPLHAIFPDAVPEDVAAWLWRAGAIVATRPAAGVAFGTAFAHGLDAALLSELFDDRDDARRSTIVIVEDTAGHEVSRA